MDSFRQACTWAGGMDSVRDPGHGGEVLPPPADGGDAVGEAGLLGRVEAGGCEGLGLFVALRGWTLLAALSQVNG